MPPGAEAGGLIIAVLCLAGFTQGLTGFGFGLVAMALLPLLIDIREASFLVVVFTILVTATTLFANRRHFSWRRGRTFVAGSLCGVPLGVYLLVIAPSAYLLQFLGALLVLFALNDLLLARHGKVRIPGTLGFPMGILSGSIAGAFNMGGPPAVAYVYSQPWSKEEIVATLQVVFGSTALLRLLLLGASGLGTRQALTLAAWAVAPVFLCILLGTRLFRRIPQPALRIAVFTFLGLMGLKYLLAP